MAYVLWSVRSDVPDVPVCRPARARRVVVALALVASVAAAGCRGAKYHVSEAARTKISGVLTTIQTDMRASCSSGPASQPFKDVVASTQQQLREILAARKSPAEYAATLIAGWVFYLEYERCKGLEKGPSFTAGFESDQQLCIAELKPWLENTAGEANAKGPCLAQAASAAPVLFSFSI